MLNTPNTLPVTTYPYGMQLTSLSVKAPVHPDVAKETLEELDAKASSTRDIDELLPVNLKAHPELRLDYANVFFCKRVANKVKEGKVVEFATVGTHYMDLMGYLANVTTYVSSLQGAIRDMYLSADLCEDEVATKGNATQFLTNKFASYRGYVSKEMLSAFVKDYIASMASGTQHIIRPSTKYPGGFDIIYSGLPPSEAVVEKNTGPVCIQMYRNRKDYPTGVRAADWETNNGQLKAAQVAVRMIEAFYDGLFKGQDATSTKSCTGRVSVMLPIDFNFRDALKKVEKIFENGMGGNLSSVFEFEKQQAATVLNRSLGKYFSILLTREANRSVVNSKIANPALAEDGYGLSSRAIAFNSNLSLSFVMHLPKELCEMITQTKDRKIPLTSLNTWCAMWSAMRFKQRGQRVSAEDKKEGKGGPTLASCPRYVMSMSSLHEFGERRKKLGYYSEPGRVNEDNLFVSTNGRVNWCPKAEDLALDNAKNYEETMEQALQLSYDAGSPIAMGYQGTTHPVFELNSPEYAKNIQQAKSNLNKYSGTLQVYDWDYNCVLTSSLSSPDKLIAAKNVGSIIGAVAADDMSAAENLRTPFIKSFVGMFPNLTITNVESGNVTAVDEETSDMFAYSLPKLVQTSVFINFAQLYAYLLHGGHVPTFQQLITDAAKELGLQNLDIAADDNPTAQAQYERNLYLNVISNSLKAEDRYNKDPKLEITPPAPAHLTQAQRAKIPRKFAAQDQAGAILLCLAKVLGDSSGGVGSNLNRIMAITNGQIDEDEHHMNAKHFNMHEFVRVYNYLGGRIFAKACQAVHKAGVKPITVIDVNNPIPTVPFVLISTEVMPAMVMFGKYIPNHENILAKADEFASLNTPDESITPDDLHLPGSTEAFELFPHQFKAMQSLARHPKFAVLDIAPGGGKTVLGLLDAGMLIHEGKIKKPLIICPDNLIKNWIEDLQKDTVTAGKWNVFPINKRVFDHWGRERLMEMIHKAPPNTMFVVGMNFLKIQKYPVVIATHLEKTSGGLEFVRMFGFDYVIIDESHRVKSLSTQIHKATKQLCTSSCIKYVRIASGSIISNRLEDVVGQAAMFTPQIFKTVAEFKKANSEKLPDGTAIDLLRKGVGKDVREQLSKFASVETFKRKDWAFLLPQPIEQFIAVGLSKEDEVLADGRMRSEVSPEWVDTAIGASHQIMYETFLEKQIENALKDPKIAAMISAKKRGKSASPDDEDDDDDDDEVTIDDPSDASEKVAKAIGNDLDIEFTENEMDALTNALNPYLQKLEMYLTDPMGKYVSNHKGNFGKEYFESIGVTNIVSNKVIACVTRIRLNFTRKPWATGTLYKERDFADYKDKRYVLIGYNEEENETQWIEEDDGKRYYKSSLPPDQDKSWKPELDGKVIVFCRYKSTVDSVFDGLPPDLKKIAVRFHGGIPNRLDLLDRFKKDPYSMTSGVQILVANEMSISEGHNLQMASRMIRMESPWSPGELDQAKSRIFRPDPSKEFTRENVYLDHILANRTMEVTKYAKLLHKIIQKAQFDEATNEKYAEVQEFQLPDMKNSLKVFQVYNTLGQIQEDYIDKYQIFTSIQAEEFRDMRKERGDNMITIPPTPMMPGSEIMSQIPYMRGMKVPDRHNLKLRNMADFLSIDDPIHRKRLEENGIVGFYVHTEMGNGIIESCRYGGSKKSDPDDEGEDESEEVEVMGRKVTSIKVRLANGDIYEDNPGLVWVVENPDVDEETLRQFSPTESMATSRDKRLAAKREKAAAKAARIEARRVEKQRQKDAAQLEKLKGLEKIKKRAGIKRPTDMEDLEEEPAEALTVQLEPVVYNGWWGVTAVSPDFSDISELSSWGFLEFGQYAYIHIRNLKSLKATIDFLETRFTLDKATRQRIEDLEGTFQGNGKPFVPEIYPANKIPIFYQQQKAHKPGGIDNKTGKPLLRMWPAVLSNKILILNVDLRTNPSIRWFKGKAVPGAQAAGSKMPAAFKIAEGQWLHLFKTRIAMVQTVRAMKKQGVNIVDWDGLVQEINQLKSKIVGQQD